MARARNIKPSFFRDAALVELPIETRLLFPGLWTLADREGRLEDKPKQIKMEIYPADSFDVDVMLAQLTEAGLIIRYHVDGKSFIQVRNFSKHQNPHRDEKPSTIPAPPEYGVSTVQARCKHGGNRASTSNLQPDSLLTPPLPPKGGCAGFDRFWAAYPKKVGKGAAEKAFAKAPINGHLADVLTALERQKHSEQWQRDGGQFIPHPATWLNQRRWEDGDPTPPQPPRLAL